MKDKDELKELARKLTILNDERMMHMRSLTHGKPLIHGLPYNVFRTCGKSNCKCASGEKHGPYPALAVNKNGIIGRNNKLLWDIPEDMKHFRRLTNHSIIVMGRRTFDSLPFGPLKSRINIVITSTPNKNKGQVVKQN